jgi:hypothetical protein
MELFFSMCDMVGVFEPIHKCSLLDDSFTNIMDMLYRKLDADQLQFVAITMRLLWLRRNTWVFYGVFQTPAGLVRVVHDQEEAFCIVEQGRRRQTNIIQPMVIQRWNKPPFGVIKLNWDAIVDKEGQKMGVGIIARDHHGTILVVLVTSRLFITDPTTAKVLVAWKMAELCVKLGFNDVLLEGDSLEVVQALCKEECIWGRYETLINDSKLLLQQVHAWKACHVKRSANEVAHRLAKLALTMCEERLWREDYPLCVQNVVIAYANFD